jgi:hypothetical protein
MEPSVVGRGWSPVSSNIAVPWLLLSAAACRALFVLSTTEPNCSRGVYSPAVFTHTWYIASRLARRPGVGLAPGPQALPMPAAAPNPHVLVSQSPLGCPFLLPVPPAGCACSRLLADLFLLYQYTGPSLFHQKGRILMGGYFWREAVSSPNSLVGLEAHVFAVVTTLLSSLDVQDGSQRPGSRVRNRDQT